MRVYIGRIPTMAKEIVELITAEGDVEVEGEMLEEVELDISSVLREYTRVDRQITDRARDQIAERQLPYNHLYKVKHQIAKERGVGIGDESVDYLCNQITEMLLHSKHVEEVYAEDHQLCRIMRPSLRRHMALDSELDQEVRNRIKNLQEGTSDWEIEYKRVMEDVKNRRNL